MFGNLKWYYNSCKDELDSNMKTRRGSNVILSLEPD